MCSVFSFYPENVFVIKSIVSDLQPALFYCCWFTSFSFFWQFATLCNWRPGQFWKEDTSHRIHLLQMQRSRYVDAVGFCWSVVWLMSFLVGCTCLFISTIFNLESYLQGILFSTAPQMVIQIMILETWNHLVVFQSQCLWRLLMALTRCLVAQLLF